MYTEERLGAFVPMAHALARKVQWSWDDHEDLVQEGLVALLKSMREYQRSGRPVLNPEGLAQQVMSAAMKWWYTPKDRTTVSCELREEHLVGDAGVDVYISEYLLALGRAHGAVAKAVAECLLYPGEHVAALALAEATAKDLRAQAGELVRGHKTIRLTHEHVRRALQLEETQWYNTLKLVRAFTRRYVTQVNCRT